MLANFLLSIFDEQHEFQDMWELKLIKFDTDLDEERKPYEKTLGVSNLVEDMKGNPGQKGCFFLTNLRLIWHGVIDKDLNLSIGLDSIVNVLIKTTPVQGFHQLKHVLIVKCISPRQTKYQFKFSGFSATEESLFKRVQQVFRKFAETKWFRSIDTNLKVINQEYKPMQGEEVKTTYEDCSLVEQERRKQIKIILTNIRLVIIHEKSSATNYGIPWIMIEKFTIAEYNGKDALMLQIRGILKDMQFYVIAANRMDFGKMHKEMVSFSQTYNKNPTLGMDFNSFEAIVESSEKKKTVLEVSELEYTKVNIGRRTNSYGDNHQKGTVRETYFNEELGIMMQKFPEGCSRADLWEILRN